MTSSSRTVGLAFLFLIWLMCNCAALSDENQPSFYHQGPFSGGYFWRANAARARGALHALENDTETQELSFGDVLQLQSLVELFSKSQVPPHIETDGLLRDIVYEEVEIDQGATQKIISTFHPCLATVLLDQTGEVLLNETLVEAQIVATNSEVFKDDPAFDGSKPQLPVDIEQLLASKLSDTTSETLDLTVVGVPAQDERPLICGGNGDISQVRWTQYSEESLIPDGFRQLACELELYPDQNHKKTWKCLTTYHPDLIPSNDLRSNLTFDFPKAVVNLKGLSRMLSGQRMYSTNWSDSLQLLRGRQTGYDVSALQLGTVIENNVFNRSALTIAMKARQAPLSLSQAWILLTLPALFTFIITCASIISTLRDGSRVVFVVLVLSTAVGGLGIFSAGLELSKTGSVTTRSYVGISSVEDLDIKWPHKVALQLGDSRLVTLTRGLIRVEESNVSRSVITAGLVLEILDLAVVVVTMIIIICCGPRRSKKIISKLMDDLAEKRKEFLSNDQWPKLDPNTIETDSMRIFVDPEYGLQKFRDISPTICRFNGEETADKT